MKEIAPRITADEKICHGKPVIKGTRVLVEVILGNLGAGMSADEVASEYRITREDVLAAIQYAASTIAGEELKVASG